MMLFARAFHVILAFAMLSPVLGVQSLEKTARQDVYDQANSLHRCWQEDDSNPGHYQLSEQIYELCTYRTLSNTYRKFSVSGADLESDDFEGVLAMFANPIPEHGVLNVCVQEEYPWFDQTNKPAIHIKCFCRRSGCNLPKDFKNFLDFNKKAIPQ